MNSLVRANGENDRWIVDVGGDVIEKMAAAASLTPVEHFVYCFWWIDYALRNSGEWRQLEDLKPEVLDDARRLAAELGLKKFSAVLDMPRDLLAERYDDLFDALCSEVRAVFERKPKKKATQKQKPPDEIALLLADLALQERPKRDAQQRAEVLAASSPAAASSIAAGALRSRLPGGAWLDRVLAFVAVERWPDLVDTAIDLLVENSGKQQELAECVIRAAALQSVSALHPHRRTLFALESGFATVSCPDAWRGVGVDDIDWLEWHLKYQPGSPSALRAFRCLLATGDEQALHLGFCLAAQTHRFDPQRLPDVLDPWFHTVGVAPEQGSYRRLHGPATVHLQFPKSHLPEERTHPTWERRKPFATATFGGTSRCRCPSCGAPAHRLLDLDPMPPECGVTTLARASFVACLSCLGWERNEQFYVHDDDGAPRGLVQCSPRITPQFPAVALRQTTVGLMRLEPRWHRQEWGSIGQNLHRLGGPPSWVQDAAYPPCPTCHTTMAFLLQLDSGLPTVDGGEHDWGSGGVCYGFWCDGCRVSAFLWQCT